MGNIIKLLLVCLLVSCQPHTHRLFWYCDNHKSRHVALTKEDRVWISEKYGCTDWYVINEEVR